MAAHTRRLRIIEGLLQGKTVTTLAREEGISRQMASRVANSPQVRRIVDEVIALRLERLGATFDAVLDGIELALDARHVRRVRTGKDGRLQTMFVDAGPDWRTAMKATMVSVRLRKAMRR